MKNLKITAILALLICLGVIISGCSFIAKNAADNAIKAAASQAGVDYNDKDGSVKITTSSGSAAFGGNLSWPKSWPGEVPKLDGKLTGSVDNSSDSNGGGFWLTLEVKDSKAVTDYVEKLTSQGFKKTTESTDNDSYLAWLANDKYNITVSVDSDNKATLSLTKATTSS